MAITISGDTPNFSAATITALTSTTGTVTTLNGVSTLNAPSGVLATQNGMTGIAKAWVTWTGGSSPAVTASFNVSSITYVSSGLFTINFTTAMANANYMLAGSATFRDATQDSNTAVLGWARQSSQTYSTTACTVQTTYYGTTGNYLNAQLAGVVFFGA
jgi:hypothetical protein